VENWDRTKDELIPQPVQSENPPTKKSKKKSNLRHAIAQSKPTFDPSKSKTNSSNTEIFLFVRRRKII
jgi:hypothetical protein